MTEQEVIHDDELDPKLYYDTFIIELRQQVTDLQVAVSELYEMILEMRSNNG